MGDVVIVPGDNPEPEKTEPAAVSEAVAITVGETKAEVAQTKEDVQELGEAVANLASEQEWQATMRENYERWLDERMEQIRRENEEWKAEAQEHLILLKAALATILEAEAEAEPTLAAVVPVVETPKEESKPKRNPWRIW